MTAPEVLAALSTADIRIVRATIDSGWTKVRRAHGRTPDGDGLYGECRDLLDDLHVAHDIAFLREIGAEQAARVDTSLRLRKITEAEQLLADARTGSAA